MVKIYGDTTQMCADVFSGFIENLFINNLKNYTFSG